MLTLMFTDQFPPLKRRTLLFSVFTNQVPAFVEAVKADPRVCRSGPCVREDLLCLVFYLNMIQPYFHPSKFNILS